MPAADEDITSPAAPTDINPYFVLSLEPEATESQIKTAYRKAALRHHPDKAAPEDKDAAHEKFQEIAFAYAILSDPARRTRYDNTGSTSESLECEEGEEGFDWTTFYREQYRNAVTGSKIDDFAKEYKGSEEERGHVLEAYEKFGGNMDKVYEGVMLSDVLEDDERFRGIIDGAIEGGEVEGLERYVGESEKSRTRRVTLAQKRKEKEAREAAKVVEKSSSGLVVKGGKKGKESGSLDTLAAMIQQRQQERSSAHGGVLEGIEAKYGASASSKKEGKKGGAKRASPEEQEGPSEEAFARNRAHGKEADAVEGGRRKRARRS